MYPSCTPYKMISDILMLNSLYINSFIYDYDKFMYINDMYIPVNIYLKYWTCLPPDIAYKSINKTVYTYEGDSVVIYDTEFMNEFINANSQEVVLCKTIDLTNNKEHTYNSSSLYLSDTHELYPDEIIAKSLKYSNKPKQAYFKPILI